MQSHTSQLKQQGVQAFDRKQYAEALAIFRSILDRRPGFADIRHLAGLCLIFLGRPDEALQELERALERNPGYVEAHINRALLLQDLGRYDEARESFEQAGEHEQQSEGPFPAAVTARLANAHAAVGDLYLDSQAFEEAAAQYRTALSLRPRFHDIRNRFAAALLGLGRPQEAVWELERILEWNPRFTSARINLGLAFHRLGRVEDAEREWRIVESQQPESAQVRAYLAMLEKQPGSGEAAEAPWG
jgi:tetratricopeptide (TPR) repeat protein